MDAMPMHLEGMEGFGSVLEVDQTPMGVLTRSTPGTYVGSLMTFESCLLKLPMLE